MNSFYKYKIFITKELFHEIETQIAINLMKAKASETKESEYYIKKRFIIEILGQLKLFHENTNFGTLLEILQKIFKKKADQSKSTFHQQKKMSILFRELTIRKFYPEALTFLITKESIKVQNFSYSSLEIKNIQNIIRIVFQVLYWHTQKKKTLTRFHLFSKLAIFLSFNSEISKKGKKNTLFMNRSSLNFFYPPIFNQYWSNKFSSYGFSKNFHLILLSLDIEKHQFYFGFFLNDPYYERIKIPNLKILNFRTIFHNRKNFISSWLKNSDFRTINRKIFTGFGRGNPIDNSKKSKITKKVLNISGLNFTPKNIFNQSKQYSLNLFCCKLGLYLFSYLKAKNLKLANFSISECVKSIGTKGKLLEKIKQKKKKLVIRNKTILAKGRENAPETEMKKNFETQVSDMKGLVNNYSCSLISNFALLTYQGYYVGYKIMFGFWKGKTFSFKSDLLEKMKLIPYWSNCTPIQKVNFELNLRDHYILELFQIFKKDLRGLKIFNLEEINVLERDPLVIKGKFYSPDLGIWYSDTLGKFKWQEYYYFVSLIFNLAENENNNSKKFLRKRLRKKFLESLKIIKINFRNS